MLHPSFQDVEAVGGAIGALMGGGGTLYAAIRGIPMLSGFLTKQVTLIHQRDRAYADRDTALATAKQYKEAAEAHQATAEAWRASVDQLTAEVQGLREDSAKARDEQHQTQEDLRKTRELLAKAVVHITSLYTFMRRGGVPPEMPDDLRDEIKAILEPLEPKESTCASGPPGHSTS